MNRILWRASRGPQAAFLRSTAREVLYGAAVGSGKLLPNSEIVWTPFGPRHNGDLQVGDKVFAADGTATDILGVFPQGVVDIFEVKFDDGSRLRTGADHLWLSWLGNQRSPSEAKLYKTSELRRGFRIPLAGPLHFTKASRTIRPTDAYTLGVLIGDGSFVGSTPRLTTADVEIAVAVNAIFSSKTEKNAASEYLIYVDIPEELKNKRSWEKHIPKAYLFAPLEDRWALLQGLMDTDGTTNLKKGNIGYSTTSKQLALDVQFLAESLGAKTKIRSRIPHYSYKGILKAGRRAYLVEIKLPNPAMAFRLERKRSRTTIPQSLSRRVVSVRKVGREAATCIAVRHASGLYVAGTRFVVTHNTDALLVAPLRWVDHPKHRALMMRRIRPNLQEMIDRSLQLYPAAVPGAQWREAESRWRFPSGAVIQMGYAEHEKDIFNFKTFEYNFIGVDELTSFTEAMYSFLFTRNRTKSADLPLQIRTATNPGDIGHDWVLNRFIGVEQLGTLKEPYKVYIENVDIGEGKIIPLGRQFIPATVWDNDSIPNKEEYIAGMISGMPAEDVAAYVYGRWDQLVGAMFKKPLIVLDGPRMLDSDYVVIRTIDYGIDDHTCVLWLLHYPKANVFDVVSELYVREMTLDGLAHLIKAREAELKLRPVMYGVGSPEMLNRKPSLEGENQSIASMLTMKGIVVEMGNKDRKAGWAKIIDLIGAAALRIWPQDALGHGSPNLVRTLPKLQRNSGPGKDPNDIRPRQEDHAADALRYGVMAVIGLPTADTPVEQQERDPTRFDVQFDKIIEDATKQHKSNFFEGLGSWD